MSTRIYIPATVLEAQRDLSLSSIPTADLVWAAQWFMESTPISPDESLDANQCTDGKCQTCRHKTFCNK